MSAFILQKEYGCFGCIQFVAATFGINKTIFIHQKRLSWFVCFGRPTGRALACERMQDAMCAKRVAKRGSRSAVTLARLLVPNLALSARGGHIYFLFRALVLLLPATSPRDRSTRYISQAPSATPKMEDAHAPGCSGGEWPIT